MEEGDKKVKLEIIKPKETEIRVRQDIPTITVLIVEDTKN